MKERVIMAYHTTPYLLLFLPAALLFYQITPAKWRSYTLLIFSYLFFWSFSEKLIIYLIGTTFLTHHICIWMDTMDKRDKRKKRVFQLGILLLLGTILCLKYRNFFFGNVSKLAMVLHIDWSYQDQLIFLPIGISFYTFQALSYVIDVYRGEVPAQHNFWHMLLYISFFPQLIAGPIVKYRDIAAQITGRKETIRKFAAGIMRFCWGLGKKVLLANSFARVVDEIFKYGPYAVSRKALWLGAILYMMQIYYDFSGYSDMAIGLGKMFGFEFQENFNYPYTAGSVQEFWHRWHISLSSWFRDYVYIPLGGNRKGAACTYRNLLIVFFLTGMWHGAGIAFILWGLYHGLFLILERVWLGKKLEKLPGIVGWGYTVIAVFFGWILFRAENISLFFTYVRNMFVAHGGTILLSAYLDSKMIFLIVMGVLFAGVLQKIYEKVRVHSAGKIPANGMVTVPRMIACLVIFWLSVAALVNNSYNPFIYFRF